MIHALTFLAAAVASCAGAPGNGSGSPPLALDAAGTVGAPLPDAALARHHASVAYDASGTPHVRARTLEDVYFAFGFACARDRLWQLEILRKSGQGRCAELLGMEKARPDFFVRALRIPENAASIVAALDRSGEPWRILSSYVEGINAYLSSPGHRLPMEFLATGTRPGAWTPEDAVAVVFLQGVDLAQWSLFDRFSYFERARAAGETAVRARAQREPYVRYETLTGRTSFSVVPAATPGTRSAAQSSAVPRPCWPLLLDSRLSTLDSQFGSNVFVLSAAKSASGKPILANDPHLRLASPSFWYRAHLSCPEIGLNVTGLSVPGVPAIVCGRSDGMAWGVTYLYADSFDLYVEKVAPGGEDAVLYRGHAEPIRTERPTVWVKVGPIRIPVFWQPLRYTRHGFLVTEDKKAGVALAVRFAGTEVTENKLRFLSMGRTKTVEAFREALRDLFQPTLNFCFASRDGHIGYQTAGFVPKRDNRDRLLAVPGDDGAFEWDGFVPFEQMPGGFDPPHGFFVNANNYPVAPEAFPSYYSNATFSHERGARIDERLRAKEKLSIADVAEIQNDVLVPDARRFLPLLRELFARETREIGADPASSEALEVLAAWDGRATVGSPSPAIWRAWYRTLQKDLDKLGLDGATKAWLDGRMSLRADRSGEHRPVSHALEKALAEMEKRYGRMPWTWGRVHRAAFRPELAVEAGGHAPDSVGAPGDRNTVCVGPSVLPEGVTLLEGPSHRIVVDLADPSSLYSVLPPGNSGDSSSPHFASEVAAWVEGRYVRVPHAKP